LRTASFTSPAAGRRLSASIGETDHVPLDEAARVLGQADDPGLRDQRAGDLRRYARIPSRVDQGRNR
jgi:hypothetical protein